jgi:putative transposase
MPPSTSTNPDTQHRFPAESISHGVWLYGRVCLSYRDVEELLFARGVIVTYEAIRKWRRKFGHAYAHRLRRRRPRPGDTWHLDGVFRTINGRRHDLGRAVSGRSRPRYPGAASVQQDGGRAVRQKAAQRLARRAWGDHHGAAQELRRRSKRGEAGGGEHRHSRDLKQCCEHSQRPARERERRLQRFKSPGHAQRFLSAYGPIARHFRPRRHRLSASAYRHAMSPRFAGWAEITGPERAA